MITCARFLLKANVAADEANGRNETGTLNKERDEIGGAVKIWLSAS